MISNIELTQLLFNIFETMIIFVGVIIALKHLKVISKTHKLSAIEKFTSDLSSFEADRHFIYQKFTFSDHEVMDSDRETIKSFLVNYCNERNNSRNIKCYCGSNKKLKHCHYKAILILKSTHYNIIENDILLFAIP